MIEKLKHWCETYEQEKDNALCLDIETEGINKPITVIGLYEPQEGTIKCDQFVKGKNLNSESLREAFRKCKILITYNGISFDLPRIRTEFPDTIPAKIPIIDLRRIAYNLGINTNLKVLENTLGIERLDGLLKKQKNTARLWRRYCEYSDTKALEMLLEYNRQDTINLYPIAETLVKMAYIRMRKEKVNMLKTPQYSLVQYE